MRNVVILIAILALAALLVGTVFAVRSRSSVGEAASAMSGEAGPTYRIVATTGMVADLARRLADDGVTVEALMGPGVDPHLYKASEGDVQRMARADLVLYSGLHLEGRLGEVFEQMAERGVPVVAVTRDIPVETLLRQGTGGTPDPHVWFDVSLWARAADTVAGVLVAERPGREQVIRQRARDLQREFALLHEYVRLRLATVPAERRVLVTAHDAFGYFGRAYEVSVAGVQGMSTSTEAGAADVRELADLVAGRRIPAVFLESSVPPHLVNALREAVASRGYGVALGGELYSDAMGPGGSDADTYTGMVRHNVESIVAGLLGREQ